MNPIQMLSVAGAICILAGFALLQTNRIRMETWSYQLFNVVGGAALLVVAIVERQFGFILLEGAWTLVSLLGIWNLMRRQAAVPPE